MDNSFFERVAPPMVLPRTDSLRWCAAAFLAALVLFSRAPGPALLAEEPKEVQPFALLKGSCFDQRGFSLPGVAILVTLPPEESGKKKEKRWRMQSDRRGEFAVRLPAGEQTVTLTARKKGYRAAEKSVQIYGDELQHVVIQMKPVSKSK
jgi:hypothetical protein